MNMTQLLEDAILGKIVNALVTNGFRVEVSDQDGGGLYVYAAAGGGQKSADGYDYWVRLVPGNGSNYISDYSTNLESVLKPVNAFAELVTL